MPVPMKGPMIKPWLQRKLTTDTRKTAAHRHPMRACGLPYDRHVSQLGHSAPPRRRAKVSPGVWVERWRNGIRRQHFAVLRHSPFWADRMLVRKSAVSPAR
jgi:hypothetical protein